MWQNNNKKIRILGISLVEDLLFKEKRVEGETIYRVKKQGELLGAYHIIVFTKNGTIPSPVQLSDNVFCYPTNSTSKLSFFKDAFRIGSIIQEREKCDLIYTQDCFATGIVGYLLKQKYKVPLCFSFAGDMVDNPYWIKERLLNRFFNVIGKWLIRKADAFRVVSKTETEKLISMGVPKEDIWNLGWMSDFASFLNADGNHIRSKYLDGREKSKILLFVGRLVEQKDLPTLLKAMPIILGAHPDTLLLLVGQGNLQTKLEKMVDELGIRKDIIFAGSIPHNEIPAYYVACDIFILPSVYEGNARALSEAQAAAKPVVATDVSGTRDTVINGVTGFIVEIQNPNQLALRVIKLLDDPAMGKEMGLKGREYVLQLYSEKNLLPGFRDMGESTVKRYSSPDNRSKISL